VRALISVTSRTDNPYAQAVRRDGPEGRRRPSARRDRPPTDSDKAAGVRHSASETW